jgi:hypothetical protein
MPLQMEFDILVERLSLDPPRFPEWETLIQATGSVRGAAEILLRLFADGTAELRIRSIADLEMRIRGLELENAAHEVLADSMRRQHSALEELVRSYMEQANLEYREHVSLYFNLDRLLSSLTEQNRRAWQIIAGHHQTFAEACEEISSQRHRADQVSTELTAANSMIRILTEQHAAHEEILKRDLAVAESKTVGAYATRAKNWTINAVRTVLKWTAIGIGAAAGLWLAWWLLKIAVFALLFLVVTVGPILIALALAGVIGYGVYRFCKWVYRLAKGIQNSWEYGWLENNIRWPLHFSWNHGWMYRVRRRLGWRPVLFALALAVLVGLIALLGIFLAGSQQVAQAPIPVPSPMLPARPIVIPPVYSGDCKDHTLPPCGKEQSGLVGNGVSADNSVSVPQSHAVSSNPVWKTDPDLLPWGDDMYLSPDGKTLSWRDSAGNDHILTVVHPESIVMPDTDPSTCEWTSIKNGESPYGKLVWLYSALRGPEGTRGLVVMTRPQCKNTIIK